VIDMSSHDDYDDEKPTSTKSSLLSSKGRSDDDAEEESSGGAVAWARDKGSAIAGTVSTAASSVSSSMRNAQFKMTGKPGALIDRSSSDAAHVPLMASAAMQNQEARRAVLDSKPSTTGKMAAAAKPAVVDAVQSSARVSRARRDAAAGGADPATQEALGQLDSVHKTTAVAEGTAGVAAAGLKQGLKVGGAALAPMTGGASQVLAKGAGQLVSKATDSVKDAAIQSQVKRSGLDADRLGEVLSGADGQAITDAQNTDPRAARAQAVLNQTAPLSSAQLSTSIASGKKAQAQADLLRAAELEDGIAKGKK
jgi:hypothetical protein